jgi:hypothetical protein
LELNLCEAATALQESGAEVAFRQVDVMAPAVRLSLGCSGGVQVAQLAAVLLERGRGMGCDAGGAIAVVEQQEVRVERGGAGKLGFGSTADPHAWERLNYTKALQGGLPPGRGGRPAGG